jgi:hypothetical protein
LSDAGVEFFSSHLEPKQENVCFIGSMNHYSHSSKFQLKRKLESELAELRSFDVLDPFFRKKKILIWFIRTNIAFFIYMMLWDYYWIRWTLLVYVPMNLASIASLFLARYFLSRKISSLEIRLRRLLKEIRQEEE